MQALLLALAALGWTLDLIIFVLDLNFWLVSSLISFLLSTLYFAFSLPEVVALSLQRCWECVLLGLVLLGENCSHLVLGTVQATWGIFNGLLLVLLYTKDTVQYGLLNVVLSAHDLHQQVSEALALASFFPSYILNSLINANVTMMKSLFSAALSLWHSFLHFIFTSKQLIFTLFSHVTGSVAAAAILVSAVVQVTVDVVVSCCTTLAGVLLNYLHGILLLLLIVGGFRWSSPAVRFFLDKLRRVYDIVLVLLCVLLDSEVWRRVADRSFYLWTMYRAAWDRYRNQRRAAQGTAIRRPEVPPRFTGSIPDYNASATRLHGSSGPLHLHDNPRGGASTSRENGAAWDRSLNQRRPSQNPPIGTAEARSFTGPIHNYNPPEARPPSTSGATHSRENSPAASVSRERASTSSENAAGEDPWKLLKQQLESKKCVICQDETKNVLLLPCRHLCLCTQCTHILLQQPILQRNCPLCRQMILHTLNVYM